MLAIALLERLRAAIEDDAYASTFQSVGQYRTALLKHIDNLFAAERSAISDDQAKVISQSENT